MKAIVLAAVLLAGCATTDRESTSAEPKAGCNAAAVQDLVGKPLSAAQADAKRRAGAAMVRSYETGAALTMDYRADRLNIETDTNGTVVKLSCG
ncbi:I78 family peptidase inhibitor [Sphingomonas mucosissima]|uniref:Peptidase inhibitor I78 family protein n=1 Tax=Sphingomonas mucosissima TaxID=370959 RepID=A0A245ZSK6_9SPHN|nr:I78 family peptidase inhibitor [Sphingomonas mucosissima]OWK32733.1 peptidase inhibitor I78 family protein [Sphingomonas mucosissima]